MERAMDRKTWGTMVVRLGVALVGAVVVAFLLDRLLLGPLAGNHLLKTQARAEAVGIPLELQDLVRPSIPTHQNAVDWIIAAHSVPSLLDPAVGGPLKRLVETGAWPLSEEDRGIARGLLAERAPAIALAWQAGDLSENNYGIPYGKGYAAEIPNLLEHIQLARLLAIEGRFQLFEMGELAASASGSESRSENRLRSLRALFKMAQALGEESTLITHVTGLAIQRGLLEIVHSSVERELLSLAELRVVKDWLEQLDSDAALRRAVAGEAIIGAKGIVAGPPYLGGFPSRGVSRPRSVAVARWQASVFLERHMEVLERVGKPWISSEAGEILSQPQVDKLFSQAPMIAIADALIPSYGDPVLRTKLVTTIKNLALDALDLAQQPNLLSGESGSISGFTPRLDGITGQPLQWSVSHEDPRKAVGRSPGIDNVCDKRRVKKYMALLVWEIPTASSQASRPSVGRSSSERPQ